MENKINTKPWLKYAGKIHTFNRNLIKVGLPYLLSSKNDECHAQWMILKALLTSPDAEGITSERAIFINRDGEELWVDSDDFAEGLYKIEQTVGDDEEKQSEPVVTIKERPVFNKEFFEKFTEVPYMIWQYDERYDQWLKQVAYIMPSLVNDTSLMISVPRAMETSPILGITNSKWCSSQITLNNPDHLQIVKLTTVMTDIPEKHNNVIIVGPTMEGENLK